MALWSTNVVAFENAFKPVSYRHWEAFKGDHNVLTKAYRRNECDSIPTPCRKLSRRSPWEDNRHENLNSFMGYIVPVPVPSQCRNICGQRFPFACSDICIPARHKKFSECNPICPRSRDSSSSRSTEERKPQTKKKDKIETEKVSEIWEPLPISEQRKPEKKKNYKIEIEKEKDSPPKVVTPKREFTAIKTLPPKQEQKDKKICKIPPKTKIVAPFKISPPKRKPSIKISEPKVIPKKRLSKLKPKDIPQEIIPPKKKESPKIKPPKRKSKVKEVPFIKTESPPPESLDLFESAITLEEPKPEAEVPKKVTPPKKKHKPKEIPLTKIESPPPESLDLFETITKLEEPEPEAEAPKKIIHPKKKHKPKDVPPAKKESPEVLAIPETVITPEESQLETEAPKKIIPPKKKWKPKVTPAKKESSEPLAVPETVITPEESRVEAEAPKKITPPKKKWKPKVTPVPKKESSEPLAVPETLIAPEEMPPPDVPKNIPPPKPKRKSKSNPPAKPSEAKPEDPKPPPKRKSKPKVVPLKKKESPIPAPSSVSSIFSDSKYPEADNEFDKLRKRQPPIVLIYGQPVLGVEIARERYLQSYVERFNAVPIKLDEKIVDWSQTPLPESDPEILKRKKHDQPWQQEQKRRELIPYAIECSKRLTSDPKSTLDVNETLELIKYAMIDSPQLKGGFIIDGFPGCLDEGLFYEPYFWPFVAGVQFLSASERISIGTYSTPPKYFRREFEYNEKEIGMIAATFGAKSIRVYGDENWSEDDNNYMNSMMELYLRGTVPFSKTRQRTSSVGEEPIDKQSFMGFDAPPITEVTALKEQLDKDKEEKGKGKHKGKDKEKDKGKDKEKDKGKDKEKDKGKDKTKKK